MSDHTLCRRYAQEHVAVLVQVAMRSLSPSLNVSCGVAPALKTQPRKLSESSPRSASNGKREKPEKIWPSACIQGAANANRPTPNNDSAISADKAVAPPARMRKEMFPNDIVAFDKASAIEAMGS